VEEPSFVDVSSFSSSRAPDDPGSDLVARFAGTLSDFNSRVRLRNQLIERGEQRANGCAYNALVGRDAKAGLLACGRDGGEFDVRHRTGVCAGAEGVFAVVANFELDCELISQGFDECMDGTTT
jgi:hypothetical protein